MHNYIKISYIATAVVINIGKMMIQINNMGQAPGYCQHFEYLKISESLSLEKEAACKYCFHSQNVWMCLSKGCMVYACQKNDMEHLRSHLDQSRRNKKFHSIFINPTTAEIRCIQCGIQIGDLDIPSNASIKNKQDPFRHRAKLLPGLQELTTHKIVGQLQNSEGHKKISKGLVGLFSSKYNYTINAAVQFISHTSFLKSLVLQINVSEKNEVLKGLRKVMEGIEEGKYRAIHSDVIQYQNSQDISVMLYKQFPQLYGYHRKDPFEIILYLLSLINQEVLYYTLATDLPYEDLDEWDMFYKKNMIRANHLVYSAIESTLSLNYFCHKCNQPTSSPHSIQFLKLNFPKKKRKVKEVEKELAAHRYGSPVKNRRKSLMNLFTEQQCPLTLPQLIIDLMKSPLHKEMNCESCRQPLKKTKLHFKKLPNILIIQLARMAKDGSSIDQTQVELSTESIDMGPFTDKPEEEVMYDFQCAVCIEKGCLFPVVVMGQFNKQKYVIRNQIVQLCKQKMNPYLLCYKRRPTESAKQKLTQIQDDLKSQRQKLYTLPDFWYLQLKNGIEAPFKNQFVCKHNYLKPNVDSKLKVPTKVSGMVYEDLHHFYRAETYQQLQMRKQSASSEGSPNMHQKYTVRIQQHQDVYSNEICEICSDQLQQLNLRRKKERQFVLMYDRLKGVNLPYCMISANWIRKWSKFLYSKESFVYMPKGYPLPLSIDNKVLLQGNKCKPNLVKNQDFKILNIYLWKFLKQLYGGGPQIRYKWKQGRQNLDEQMLADIKYRATDLKVLYSGSYIESPKKLMNSLSFINQSSASILEESIQSPSKHHSMVIEELEDQES